MYKCNARLETKKQSTIYAVSNKYIRIKLWDKFINKQITIHVVRDSGVKIDTESLKAEFHT